jgi:hypothetical protein
MIVCIIQLCNQGEGTKCTINGWLKNVTAVPAPPTTSASNAKKIESIDTL